MIFDIQSPTIIVMPADQSTLNQTTNVSDVLFAEHLINQAQYRDIKLKAATLGESEETVIDSLKIVNEEKLAEVKAKMLGVPYISLDSASFSPQALGFVPQVVVQRFNIIPFAYDERTKTLSIAMGNPVDLDAISFVRQKTGLNVKAFAASPGAINQAIDIQYRQELVGQVGEALKETEELHKTKTIDSTQIAQIIKEAPIAKIVSTILEYAVKSRASDIHIEPQEERVRVRYRIDGILYDRLSLPKSVQESVVSRIKILSEMKIDEHRIPQDGRFNFKTEDKEVDLRISVLPAAHGEKIVMRLLRKSGGVPTLEELGLWGTALRNLKTNMLRPHGIIIVCGPTGSGKTTTLYSVLNQINSTRVNVMTLEDPIEYQMPGVNQIQINPAVGLTFATGLRAFLRQDPNVILVGEIRDKDTTELAIQAALTGHLVFSTLHTSNASGALPRLIDLGAETFLLSSTMNAVVGQRIVRKICQTCKVSLAPPQQVAEDIKKELGRLLPPETIKLYKGQGCIECGNSGYLGRVGIFEVLPVNEKIADLILKRSDSYTLEKEAVLEGMITMKQDGYLKVLKGITTIEEVLRVAQE